MTIGTATYSINACLNPRFTSQGTILMALFAFAILCTNQHWSKATIKHPDLTITDCDIRLLAEVGKREIVSVTGIEILPLTFIP